MRLWVSSTITLDNRVDAAAIGWRIAGMAKKRPRIGTLIDAHVWLAAADTKIAIQI